MHVPSVAIRPQLDIVAAAPLPTRFGTFQMMVFRWWGNAPTTMPEAPWLSPDHVALVIGDIRGHADVLVRVHSECLTSEVFGSLKCDCKEQLETAQAEIARQGVGAVVYLRQEGRGIGLGNKIRAYQLQLDGHDTVDANRMLGLPDDARDYAAAGAMLLHLGPASIRLMTNNPAKVDALRAHGVTIADRVPMVVDVNRFSRSYLETKRSRMGHTIPPLADAPEPAPSSSRVIVGDAE